jgi:hypothetical protein
VGGSAITVGAIVPVGSGGNWGSVPRIVCGWTCTGPTVAVATDCGWTAGGRSSPSLAPSEEPPIAMINVTHMIKRIRSLRSDSSHVGNSGGSRTGSSSKGARFHSDEKGFGLGRSPRWPTRSGTFAHGLPSTPCENRRRNACGADRPWHGARGIA